MDAGAATQPDLRTQLVETVHRQRTLERELYGQARTELPIRAPLQHYRLAALDQIDDRELEASERTVRSLEAQIDVRDQRRMERFHLAWRLTGLFLLFLTICVGGTVAVVVNRTGFSAGVLALLLGIGVTFFLFPVASHGRVNGRGWDKRGNVASAVPRSAAGD